MQPNHIFQPNDDLGFVECHGSTIISTTRGWLVAFFAGTCERHPDTAIWVCRQVGDSWDCPRVVAKVSDKAHWNPVLFRAGDVTRLFFKEGSDIETWRTWYMDCDKDGEVWTQPVLIEPDLGDEVTGRGPVRSRPIILSDGSWLAPASHEHIVGYLLKTTSYGAVYRLPEGVWNAFVDRSEDGGRTWKRSEYVPYDRTIWGEKGGIIQPVLWEHPQGHVHMLARSTLGVLFRSLSTDYGRTWSPAEPADIPNPNSAVDILLDGRILVLAYNPVAGNWIRRSPLSLSFSIDDGLSWTEPWNLIGGKGSYSYPSLCGAKGGVAITYTWNRKSICFARLSFIFKDIVNGLPVVEISSIV